MSTPNTDETPQDVLSYERSPRHVPVATFPDATEARMAASRLESEDVDCEIVEHAILAGISARRATISVETEHLPRAVEILSATPARRWLVVKGVVDPPASPDDPGRPLPARGLVARVLSRLRQGRAGDSMPVPHDVSAPATKQ